MKFINFLIILFFISSCVTTNESGMKTGISAGSITSDSNENFVYVNKNSFMTTMDTYKIALDHCLNYKKSPKLIRKASALDFWMKDKYQCVKK